MSPAHPRPVASLSHFRPGGGGSHLTPAPHEVLVAVRAAAVAMRYYRLKERRSPNDIGGRFPYRKAEIMTASIRWFDRLGMDDVPIVGGKNASLGEMRRALTPLGIRTPDGFATTADAYREFLRGGGLESVIGGALRDLDVDDLDRLQAAGARVRSAILAAPLPDTLVRDVGEAYAELEAQYGANCDVAVRSSATAEDLPEASFAGQQETFLNIHGPAMLLDALRRCFASLFTDRAIVYRAHRGFDHLE